MESLIQEGTQVNITGGKYKGKKGVVDFISPRGGAVVRMYNEDGSSMSITEQIDSKYLTEKKQPTERACRVCGCTEYNACSHPEHGRCWWVEGDLCSHCKLWPGECKKMREILEEHLESYNVGSFTSGRDFSNDEGLKAFVKNLNGKVEPPENNVYQNHTNMKKIAVPLAPLLAVLKKVKEVISKHPTINVLSNVLIKVRRTDIQIIATDCIVTLEGTIEVDNIGGLFGYEFLLPFKFLLDTCQLVNTSQLTIELIERVETQNLTEVTQTDALLTGYEDEYFINCLESTVDWPLMPQFPVENSVGINDDFIEWLNKAVTTASSDALRPALQKVHIGISRNQIALASTNAHVVMEKTFGVETEHYHKLLIDTKIAKALKGFDETSISWSDTHLAVVSDNMRLIGTIQDEKFPDYQAIFPPLDGNLNLQLAEFTGVMEKVSLTEKEATIYLLREKNFITIESENLDYNRKIKIKMAAYYTGDCEKIIINPKNMLLLLKQVDYSTVLLSIVAPNRPIIITAEADPSYRSLIIPMTDPNA